MLSGMAVNMTGRSQATNAAKTKSATTAQTFFISHHVKLKPFSSFSSGSGSGSSSNRPAMAAAGESSSSSARYETSPATRAPSSTARYPLSASTSPAKAPPPR